MAEYRKSFDGPLVVYCCERLPDQDEPHIRRRRIDEQQTIMTIHGNIRDAYTKLGGGHDVVRPAAENVLTAKVLLGIAIELTEGTAA